MSALISVQLDAVEALAAELAALAVALAGEGPLCTSTAGSLASLGGPEGFTAYSAAWGWVSLVDALASRTGAVATTLSAAVAGYRTVDAQLAERVGPGRRGATAIAR